MQIIGVAFDMDGVLIPESEAINIAAAKQTFSDFGLPLREAELATIPGQGSKTYVPRLLRVRGISSEQEAGLIAVNRSNYDRLWPKMAALAPHLDDVLLALEKRDIALAVATTNRRAVVERFLTLLGRQPFRVIVASEDVVLHKPDPEVYRVAGEHLGIPAENLLAVEDTAVGIKAAKAAGLWCAAIRNSFTTNEDFSEADCRLDTLAELPKLIEKQK